MHAAVPISVFVQGRLPFSSSSSSSFEALELITPPPYSTTGRSELFIIPATFSMSSPVNLSCLTGTTLPAGVNSHSAAVTSFVMSTSTGPGRSDTAILNASLKVSASSSTLRTTKLCLVMGMVMPAMYTSWKLSRPIRSEATLPVIATMGTLSINAVAMPVTRLVAPGPEVASTTPVLPVARAYPSAACAAPCSWAVIICFILSEFL